MEGIQASHGEERRQLEEVSHLSFLSVHHIKLHTIFPTNSARYFSERLINSQAVFKIRLTGDGKISWLKSKSAEISEAL